MTGRELAGGRRFRKQPVFRRYALGTAVARGAFQVPADREVPVRPNRAVLMVCASLSAIMLWPARASAQHTHVFVSAGFYASPPYFYSPFYYPYFGFGWAPWYPYPYAAPYYYPPRLANISQARLEMKPRQAQVYLDGYYMGVVDDFDGTWQRLDMPSGEHEIVVYLKGYQTYHQRTFFRPGQDYHFKAILEPLAPDAVQEPVPQPAQSPPGANQPGNYPPPGSGENPRIAPSPQAPRPDSTTFGRLSLRVQPPDAIVTVDGERWDSPEGGNRLVILLPPGPHRVDVQKEGLRPYTSTVEIHPNETQSLNISLARE